MTAPGALRAASRGRSHRLADDIAGRVLFDAATARRRTLDAGRSDAGDLASADRVELTLPETGVCGGAGLFDAPDTQEADGGACCAPAPQLVQLGAPAAVGTTAERPPTGGCCGS
ncbi:hypothetical protein SGLAM104S_05360 [Streptomyces glaucescens]